MGPWPIGPGWPRPWLSCGSGRPGAWWSMASTDWRVISSSRSSCWPSAGGADRRAAPRTARGGPHQRPGDRRRAQRAHRWGPCATMRGHTGRVVARILVSFAACGALTPRRGAAGGARVSEPGWWRRQRRARRPWAPSPRRGRGDESHGAPPTSTTPAATCRRPPDRPPPRLVSSRPPGWFPPDARPSAPCPALAGASPVERRHRSDGHRRRRRAERPAERLVREVEDATVRRDHEVAVPEAHHAHDGPVEP